MCAKDDLIRRKMLFQTHNRQLAGEPATAESITAKEYEDIAKTSSLSRLKADQHFFVYQNILSLIAFIISHRPFADELPVYVTIRNLSREARRRRSTPSTLLARFIPTTKIRDPLLKSQVYHYCISKLLSPLENAAKSRILLACADRRTRQCYPTIYAILANYEEQVLLTSIKKNRHCTRYTKHHNFNIHVSLATDTLHLLLKGLVMKMLDFMQDILDDIYPSKQKAIIQQLIAIVSPLFVSKAPFALHFIRAVCDLVTLAQYKSHDEDTLAYIQGALERMNVFKEEFRVYRRTLEEEKNFNYPKALDSICTRANSEAHHITISIPGIQPHSTKLPLSEVAANIAISDFTHAAAVFVRNKRQAAAGQLITSYDEDRLDVQEFKHRDNRRQSRTVTDGRVVAQLHLILTIIDHTRYDKDRKHIAYIRAFSEVLLFNNNRQINNTTRMLSVPFKFYDLSTIIRPVHLVPRDLPNSTTRTTMSYYVNNYID
ncbi:hypothetical protein HBI86_247450 [Parastagonospora nodorum]|nr:hypothetical protein HBI86_247450 [Parastagonospora nodorum]KAH5950284.1 hypothetical protein HBI85_251300 [Parastagonospora nodorum]